MSLVVFDNPALAFIHIPKSGGTSVSAAIAMAGNNNGWEFKQNNLYTHADLSDLICLMGEDWGARADIIAVIRNPWDRLVSLYNFRLTKAIQWIDQRAQGQTVKRGTSDKIDKEAVAEMQELGFIRWILETRCHEEQYGMPLTRKPQISWCRDAKGYLSVTKLMKLGSLDMDYFRSIGVTSIPELNRFRVSCEYRNLYDTRARHFVQKYFEEDIDVGRYSF